jgi:hypothetical protein
MSIIQLVHPYVSTAADPFCNERENSALHGLTGPMAYFTGDDIPQVTEVIFVKYAPNRQSKVDSAAATTVGMITAC